MFIPLDFIKQLTAIHERQRRKEQQAARLILRVLKKHGCPFSVQTFQAKTPVVQACTLLIDGKSIPAHSTSFVGGCIHGKHAILSSLLDPQLTPHESNINFNPECVAISRSNHYFAPSLAVAKEHVPLILNAKQVEGVVKVKQHTHTSCNILIGNKTSPKHILLCHYDSFGPGATDNASGTATLLALALNHPEVLTHCLLVISGNEELSYDQPIYWGHGYRIFEQRYSEQVKRAKQLIMVDCVGNGKTQIDTSADMIQLGLPFKDINLLKKNVRILYGDVEKLMQVYHSDLDTIETLTEAYLKDAIATCIRLVK
jgi:hypothetical protein